MSFDLLNMFTKYSYRNLQVLYIIKRKLNVGKHARNNINFVSIYEFPYVRICSMINRLKLYHTFLTIMTVPGTAILSSITNVGADFVIATASIGFAGGMVFYTLGYVTTKVIGCIYLSEDKSTVKVSSVDFWGRRKDELIPTSDIIPLSDLPISIMDALYMKMRRFSKEDYLKLNIKFAIIRDPAAFDKLFK